MTTLESFRSGVESLRSSNGDSVDTVTAAGLMWRHSTSLVLAEIPLPHSGVATRQLPRTQAHAIADGVFMGYQ